MIDIVVPMFAGIIVFFSLVIYILAVAVKTMAGQITKISDKLLTINGIERGGRDVSRALLAMTKRPKRLPEEKAKPAEEKRGDDRGFTMTIGA